MDKDVMKIFSSTITRSNVEYRNDFTDITKITPARPLTLISNKNVAFDYKPRTDKYYIPKKRIGLVKVKTVRDIRNTFEKDVYSYLSAELEKQRNTLFRKIRFGLSKTEKTKKIAKDILKQDIPISKTAWHMIMNINPNEHVHPTQFVLWNGKHIQLNGSKGGSKKFICNYDIGKIVKYSGKKIFTSKNTCLSKKKSLLQNSLKIEFKPGPLTRKKYLDTSYQKYQFGNMELVNLPKPGLEIQPALNMPLGPSITNFLYQTFLPDFSSNITEKWAEFAVSVLGSDVKGNITQSNEKPTVSFGLTYKRSQNRLLMRHDIDTLKRDINITQNVESKKESSDFEIISNVRNILDEIIIAVDISINQDQMYTGEDERRDISTNENTGGNTNLLTKPKRKFHELDRLDVTVIRISETTGENRNEWCKNDYCSLGCICSSLQSSFKKINHCGKIECMFNCKCGFLTYDLSDYVKNGCSEVITDFINIDKKSNIKLAKEEQKFHQTVIVTDDKSILLKTRKRDWKTPKKYSDFYSQMQLKPGADIKKQVSVTLYRLNLKNVEPFCMIHKLYKCFCKGVFTNTNVAETAEQTVANENTVVSENVLVTQEFNKALSEQHSQQMRNLSTNSNYTATATQQENLRPRRKNSKDGDLESVSMFETNMSNSSNDINDLITCARFLPYTKRKYSKVYYENTNKKIKELEQNDKGLHTKMLNLIAKSECVENGDSQDLLDISPPSPALKELLTSFVEEKIQSPATESVIIKSTFPDPDSSSKRLPYKAKLVSWLEYSYKQYKMRIDQGIIKLCLDPPKFGKLMLYPWDFILTRYRDRKNYFMTSKQKPFRIFLAVDTNSSFFEKCINISDIPWSDLHKYPITIKNLLTNATGLLDNFCILYGLSNCWELIGSVTKVSESRIDNLNDLEGGTKLSNQSTKEISTENSKWLPVTYKNDSKTNSTETPYNKNIPNSTKVPKNKNCNNDSEALKVMSNTSGAIKDKSNLSSTVIPQTKCDLSKWFLMSVENDFIEIQFYQKGFFVKYESIIKAIDVARSLNKTVRLSSQKCNVAENESQFGIYAIPVKEKHCVFIGPYEKGEFLGIETIQNMSHIGKNRTKGIWITTNKVDNANVIEDPLSFLPSEENNTQEIVPLINVNNSNTNDQITMNIATDSLKRKSTDLPKLVKPIKITKTNSFYHLAPNGLFQQISPTKAENPIISQADHKSLSNQNKSFLKPLLSISTSSNESSSLLYTTKPIAEVSPQIKSTPELTTKKPNSMFVLKPEEINKRSMENTVPNKTDTPVSFTFSEEEEEDDIEKFLATSVDKIIPNADIYVISDDDEEKCKYDEVYILCKNINIGWVPGKQKSDGHLSFEFPGFKETEFYTGPCEAFKKINQVLSRKVFIPKQVLPEWTICKKKPNTPKLQLSTLNSDFVLTKNGFRRKSDITKKNDKSETNFQQEELRVYSGEKFINKGSSVNQNLGKTSITFQKENDETWSNVIQIKNVTSLENENEELWSNAIQIKNVISEASDHVRQEYSDHLTNIWRDAQSIDEPFKSSNQMQQERTLLTYLQTNDNKNTLKSPEDMKQKCGEQWINVLCNAQNTEVIMKSSNKSPIEEYLEEFSNVLCEIQDDNIIIKSIHEETQENREESSNEVCEIGTAEITLVTTDELNTTLCEIQNTTDTFEYTNELEQDSSKQLANASCEAQNFMKKLENT